jgi:hypothetical protein
VKEGEIRVTARGKEGEIRAWKGVIVVDRGTCTMPDLRRDV